MINSNILSFQNILYTNFSFIWHYRNIIFVIAFIFGSIISIIIFLIVIYLFKCLKKFIFSNCVYFNKYNNTTLNTIKLYGDYKITGIYLVKYNINYFIYLFMNIFSINEFSNILTCYRNSTGKDIMPMHASIIVEIEINRDEKKLILIEKNLTINITTDFFLSKKCTYKHIPFTSNITINNILNFVKTDLGKKKYFNWYKNNTCQHFINSILKYLKINTKKNKQFIKQDLFYKNVKISNRTIYILNFILNLHNIFYEIIFQY